MAMLELQLQMASEAMQSINQEVDDLTQLLRLESGRFTAHPERVRMEKIFRKLDRVVNLDVPVLIMGETGTGKELIAQALHRSSPRSRRRFYAQNCGAISEGLLESELFGYTRGAFTGADRDKKGLFEVSSGSTLFLDEIGEMNLDMQKKLLRVLQEGEVRRVGGKDIIHVDVRVISATNKDLRRLVTDSMQIMVDQCKTKIVPSMVASVTRPLERVQKYSFVAPHGLVRFSQEEAVGVRTEKFDGEIEDSVTPPPELGQHNKEILGRQK